MREKFAKKSGMRRVSVTEVAPYTEHLEIMVCISFKNIPLNFLPAARPDQR